MALGKVTPTKIKREQFQICTNKKAKQKHWTNTDRKRESKRCQGQLSWKKYDLSCPSEVYEQITMGKRGPAESSRIGIVSEIA